jgi:hypothetical protein
MGEGVQGEYQRQLTGIRQLALMNPYHGGKGLRDSVARLKRVIEDQLTCFAITLPAIFL